MQISNKISKMDYFKENCLMEILENSSNFLCLNFFALSGSYACDNNKSLFRLFLVVPRLKPNSSLCLSIRKKDRRIDYKDRIASLTRTEVPLVKMD